ncbi:UNVERIFIED_ORG: hypothetical protein B2H93_15970 [Clostridium botulinum]
MSYMVYLDKILLPITPEKIQTKINNKNKTYALLNSSEMNVLKDPGLTEISFDILLPNMEYPFAVYKSGFKKAKYYLQKIEKFKINKSNFRLIISRQFPNGDDLQYTSMQVSLEDYTVNDDVKYGFDTSVSIKLKQYVSYVTKAVALPAELDAIGVALQATTQRADTTGNSPAAVGNTPNPYKVVSGDCLFNICKKYLGDGNKCWEVAKFNGLSNPNNLSTGDSIYFPS